MILVLGHTRNGKHFRARTGTEAQVADATLNVLGIGLIKMAIDDLHINSHWSRGTQPVFRWGRFE
jgi:hypothetical protein